MVEIIALAHFSDSVMGSVTRKQKRQVPVAVAQRLERLGLVKITNPQPAAATKRAMPSPIIAGQVAPPSLLQAVQALRTKTSRLSDHSIVNQLQSMTPTAAHCLPTSFMPATSSGGDTIISLSAMVAKVRFGLKTKELPKNTKSTTSKAKTRPA